MLDNLNAFVAIVNILPFDNKEISNKLKQVKVNKQQYRDLFKYYRNSAKSKEYTKAERYNFKRYVTRFRYNGKTTRLEKQVRATLQILYIYLKDILKILQKVYNKAAYL